MIILLFSLTLVLVLALLATGSLEIKAGQLSKFELKRRHDLGDTSASQGLRRLELLPAVRSLQTLVEAVLLVGLAGLLMAWLGWVIGPIWLLAIVIIRGPVSRLGWWRRLVQRRYKAIEPSILETVSKWGGWLNSLRLARHDSVSRWRLHSVEEFKRLIDKSGYILTPSQQAMLGSSLEFDDRLVSHIMVPRDKIHSVKAGELLGPLVLNDLHKTGHSLFPVIDKDLDDVLGILNVEQLLTLETKQSTTAKKAMQSEVVKVLETKTLRQALAICLDQRQMLLIVQDESHQTVGLILLGDIIAALLGERL